MPKAPGLLRGLGAWGAWSVQGVPVGCGVLVAHGVLGVLVVPGLRGAAGMLTEPTELTEPGVPVEFGVVWGALGV